jgi:hypothetical protein
MYREEPSDEIDTASNLTIHAKGPGCLTPRWSAAVIDKVQLSQGSALRAQLNRQASL